MTAPDGSHVFDGHDADPGASNPRASTVAERSRGDHDGCQSDSTHHTKL